MTQITISRTIKAPASQVWNVIGDYNNPHKYHPFLESVDQLSEEDRGMGAKRQCNLYNNSSVVEEVIEWVDGQSFTVLASDQPLYGEVTGVMSVKPIDGQSARVTVETSYTPKLGVVGKILDLFVLRFGVRYAVGRVLKALQHYIETDVFEGAESLPAPLNS